MTPEEVAVVKHGLQRYARISTASSMSALRTSSSTIQSGAACTRKCYGSRGYKKDRTFRVQRWCFKGSIDDWIDLWMSGGVGKLPVLVQTFCPHLGRDSFYDLMWRRSATTYSPARLRLYQLNRNTNRLSLSNPVTESPQRAS